MDNLRKSFDETLGATGLCPENSLYFVALGAALSSEEEVDIQQAIEQLEHYKSVANYHTIPPLFENKAQYEAFATRHAQHTVPECDPKTYEGEAYLGIDAGSTTLKLVVISNQNEILLQSYQPNNGNPVPIIQKFLHNFYAQYPRIRLAASAVTGYGEEIVQNAFGVDFGIVETMAHFTAAKEFMPNVDFIIDIGGQDIKCFQIKNGAIDNLFLNEACSSGCGSFLQTFANALGFSIEEFARRGLFADKPVDLGSRCTVFMNSSVKQAQKDGASIENISAGLSVSVVKNALYKVIRASKGQMQGLHIVVQGGTFLNDAVLRAFEQELGVQVVRPAIAGLMGAFGAALYAKAHQGQTTALLGPQELTEFVHTVKVTTCGLCQNHCRLTINSFGGGRKFIGGNRCERPITKKASGDELNIYAYKLSLLQSYQPTPGPRGKIGIPMGLNMFELLPFWHAFWSHLGFEVVYSPLSNRELYLLGQATIPSDTVCFPAKLMHGHVQTLINQGIDRIFYPCMSYNLDEHLGDNHYNCPVVAYYPEVIGANMPDVADILFMHDYWGLHRQKDFPKKAWQSLQTHFPDITLAQVKTACKAAFAEYHAYFAKVKQKGEEIIAKARAQGMPIVVLAGRPYHVDPEINHGIDKLVLSCKAAVISEDVISDRVEKFKTHVLNQWTYHSRLYAAAKYIATQKDMQLVQLVSFGCGVDAITTDEVRTICETGGKIYTQIKIDEITNLGAVKIRLRSLFAAIEQ